MHHPLLKIFFYFIPKFYLIFLDIEKTNKKVKLLHYGYCEL